ncbi:MAG TPA: hypothetical protein VJZ00_15735 [Thermoanaerobaculia bacterium]|nr:hypothetical protein [Thermoanaerobaculia bacterium]
MKRIPPLTLVVSLLVSLMMAAPVFAAIEGAWTASNEDKFPGRIYFNITYGRQHQNGSTMELSTFSGLTEAQINATAMTPVQFFISREAGKATFDGTFRNGKGAGQFTFEGNPAYPEMIEKLGVKFDLDRGRRGRDRDEEETLFTLALFDVSTAFIRSMQAEGYRETLQKYLEMRIFNITPEYIHEMRSLGFRNIDADELVASRIHKVTPAYVREMRAAGWDLSLEEYQSSRIFGLTPQFAEDMKKLGYGDLSHDQLTAFRIHKVTAEFISEMRGLGYDRLSADDLVAFRIHHVTPDFIKELRTLGYNNVDADDLVAMRIHHVTPEFIRQLGDAGYHNVPVEKLVALKINGLDAKYIKRMNGHD